MSVLTGRLASLLAEGEPAPSISDEDARAVTTELARLTEMQVYPRSIAVRGGCLFFLGKGLTGKMLGVLSREGNPSLASFSGQVIDVGGQGLRLRISSTDHSNAIALRQVLPYTKPQVLGVRKSVGCGDRLGLATPGHVRAVRGTGFAPIFAQQSIREMVRTQRTPEEVMDDATWGVFQEGWRGGFGSDADHLKTPEDIDRCVAAGFTLFTIDPSDHVDNKADADLPGALAQKVKALPWDGLESTPGELRCAFLGRKFHLEGGSSITFSEEDLLRAAAKYGSAVAHIVRMYRHLATRMGERPFELEVSVDETETPTSIQEHFFVASELLRLGVVWVSLAPRYVGRFEKGVDYIGDRERFEEEFVKHISIARSLGPYKLSLHSGSDKFSLYPIIAEHAGELVHLKTSGTSYLEALRVVAGVDPSLFREILAFACQRYEEDKATYHVSADPSRMPSPEQLADGELPGVLDLFDGRQILHITFGSVMSAVDGEGRYRFRHRLLAVLAEEEETYYEALEGHMRRHLVPFEVGRQV